MRSGPIGLLRPDSPFGPVFPDGRVPLNDIAPIVPREVGAPLCYLVAVDRLTDAQIDQLAVMIYTWWRPECESVDEAERYLREQGLPLRTSHFLGVVLDARLVV